jgi:hypothetical protein
MQLTLRKEFRLRVFENRVLRRIFEPKRDEVTGEWRKLHNKELYALYSSSVIIRVLKSKRLRLAGYVACTAERIFSYRVLNLREEDRLEDPGVGRTILKWICERLDTRGRNWIDVAQVNFSGRTLVHGVSILTLRQLTLFCIILKSFLSYLIENTVRFYPQ